MPRWLPSIARHLRQLAVAQHVSEQGGGPKDIARELGLRRYLEGQGHTLRTAYGLYPKQHSGVGVTGGHWRNC